LNNFQTYGSLGIKHSCLVVVDFYNFQKYQILNKSGPAFTSLRSGHFFEMLDFSIIPGDQCSLGINLVFVVFLWIFGIFKNNKQSNNKAILHSNRYVLGTF
jgi:hypothetical protein